MEQFDRLRDAVAATEVDVQKWAAGNKAAGHARAQGDAGDQEELPGSARGRSSKPRGRARHVIGLVRPASFSRWCVSVDRARAQGLGVMRRRGERRRYRIG